MTTGAMVLGALPLLLSTSAGAECRQQIGWVIAGGMSLGTLLTLFAVPVVSSIQGQQLTPHAVDSAKDLPARPGVANV